jgi:hypothetical protein
MRTLTRSQCRRVPGRGRSGILLLLVGSLVLGVSHHFVRSVSAATALREKTLALIRNSSPA